jgi:hypothetical protein
MRLPPIDALLPFLPRLHLENAILGAADTPLAHLPTLFEE